MDRELREDRCETCRFWDCWDEDEPQQITIREQFARLDWDISDFPDLDPDCVTSNEDRIGDCKRFPPHKQKDGEQHGVWLYTSTDRWCGEWQPKGTPPNPVLAHPIATVEDVLAAITPPPSA